jgi:hypothetical protein
MEHVHLVALHPIAALCWASTVNETRQAEVMFGNTCMRTLWDLCEYNGSQ